MRTKRIFSRGLILVQAYLGFKPLPTFIYEAHVGDGSSTNVRSQQSDVIIGLFGEAIQKARLVQSFESGRFIGRKRGDGGRICCIQLVNLS